MYITDGGEGHSYVSVRVDFSLGQQRGNFNEMNNERRGHGQMHGHHHNEGHRPRHRNQRRDRNKDKAIAIIYGKRCEAEYFKNQFREIDNKIRNCDDEIYSLGRSLGKIESEIKKENRNLAEVENLTDVYRIEYEEAKRSRDKGPFTQSSQRTEFDRPSMPKLE